MSHFSPRLPYVALLGADGSGKSTILRELEKIFVPPLTAGMRVFHRSDLVGGKKTPGAPHILHQVARPHSPLVSMGKLSLRAGEWVFQRQFYRHTDQIVFLDRYYLLDVLIDPLRYRYGGPLAFARWLARVAPRPDLIFLLDAPSEVLLARKQEVPAAEVARQRAAYLALVQSLPRGYILDTTRPLAEVVTDIKHIVTTYMDSSPN